VAVNGDAEKLFNYLVAYRKSIQPISLKDPVTVEAFLPEETETSFS
jgi:hypothetical protein